MPSPWERLQDSADDLDHPWLTPATRRTWRGLRSRHRRAIIAGLLAAMIVLVGANLLTSLSARTPVLVATRDLPAGHRLTADDLVSVRIPATSVPATAVVDPAAITGVLSSPMAAREVLTSTRLVQPYATDGLLVPVRLPDADVAGLLRPGDVIDVLAAEPVLGGVSRPAQVVAERVTVATIPEPLDSGMSPTSGAVIVISTDERTAQRLAGAAATATLSVALHP